MAGQAARVSTSFVDVNGLFERSITIQLRRHLSGSLGARDQEHTHLEVERNIPMRPDLVAYRRGAPALVADVPTS